MSDTYEPYRTGLPSPEELKNKILVKAKKIQIKPTTSASEEEEESEEEEMLQVTKKPQQNSTTSASEDELDETKIPKFPVQESNIKKRATQFVLAKAQQIRTVSKKELKLTSKKDSKEKRKSDLKKSLATHSTKLNELINYAGD